jgi:AcrR family transcriptional regulator
MLAQQEHPATKRRLSAEERQDEIVRVAIDLAADRGVDAVTTQDMAKAMGLTQGAIFRHFPTKDDIWVAAIGWVRGQLLARVEKAAAQGGDPIDSLERMFHAHIGFIAKHPAIPRLIFSDELRSKNPRLKQLIQEIITGYERKIAALLRAAKEQGLARADLDEESAATLFIGMIQGLVLQSSIFAGKRELTAQAKKVFPVYLNCVWRTDWSLI